MSKQKRKVEWSFDFEDMGRSISAILQRYDRG